MDVLVVPLKLINANVEVIFLYYARAINMIVNYCFVKEIVVIKVMVLAWPLLEI